MRKYNINAGHWKSVWQGPECSPVNGSTGEWFKTTVGVRQGCLLSPALVNIFLERIMCEALDDHEGSVSIRARLITNFRFADDIVVNAEEEKEAGVLIDRLDRTTTRYKMEIGPDKTKVMTNNRFQREIKINGQRLEEVENFKYLGAIISNEGSKPKILSRIAQTTAALSTLYARSFRRRFFVYHHAVKHPHTRIILSWLSIPLVLKCAAKTWKSVCK